MRRNRPFAYVGLTLVLSFLAMEELPAPPEGYNYDEDKVPTFTLPDPLVFDDGRRIEDPEEWPARRAELLKHFRRSVYGRAPIGKPEGLRFELRKEVADFLDGKAELKEIRVHFTGEAEGPGMDLLLVIPKERKGKVPAFLGLNFAGNHAVHPSEAITLPSGWMRPSRDSDAVVDNRATEQGRGRAERRWPLETIVSRGYAVATVYYGDIDPDFDDGFENGVHAVFDVEAGSDGKSPKDAWGSIATWAWGLSRALDCLEEEPLIDAERVAVLGHSRLGKTALWAGASDERFALVVSNNSGCGGAALSRREFGETVERINTSFPHWFCDAFVDYNEKVNELPVDQHQLIALIAPRPAYIASASEDVWADPRGEFLSGFHAEPVYRLFGYKGLDGVEWPAVNTPVGDRIGYHLREGKHDVLEYDWERYMDFADRHWAM